MKSTVRSNKSIALTTRLGFVIAAVLFAAAWVVPTAFMQKESAAVAVDREAQAPRCR